MKYLLDFDLTLLNTDALKARVFADGTESLVGTVEFWDHYKASEFLYDDVVTWLASKTQESLHILTAFKPSQGPGAEAFQRAKIMSSGLSNYFGSITVMEGMKGESAAHIATHFLPDEPIAFVDDILEQCESVKSALPNAHCFLMQRKGTMQCSIDTPICPVSCLLDVDSIMMSL